MAINILLHANELAMTYMAYVLEGENSNLLLESNSETPANVSRAS